MDGAKVALAILGAAPLKFVRDMAWGVKVFVREFGVPLLLLAVVVLVAR